MGRSSCVTHLGSGAFTSSTVSSRRLPVAASPKGAVTVDRRYGSTVGALEPGEHSLLTPRQLEILAQLHLPNKEIGLRLGLAEVTVKMHVSSIFRVLNVANRTQAMQVARRLALLADTPAP